MQSNQKMLKLVLRFICIALREEGVFEACKEPHTSSGGHAYVSAYRMHIDTVCEVVDILAMLAAHSW